MKRNFIVQLPDDQREDLEAVAEKGHMTANTYAAVWLRELSELKPEFALKVLGLIPTEWKKRGPGRPPTSTTRADATSATTELASENVA